MQRFFKFIYLAVKFGEAHAQIDSRVIYLHLSMLTVLSTLSFIIMEFWFRLWLESSKKVHLFVTFDLTLTPFQGENLHLLHQQTNKQTKRIFLVNIVYLAECQHTFWIILLPLKLVSQTLFFFWEKCTNMSYMYMREYRCSHWVCGGEK